MFLMAETAGPYHGVWVIQNALAELIWGCCVFVVFLGWGGGGGGGHVVFLRFPFKKKHQKGYQLQADTPVRCFAIHENQQHHRVSCIGVLQWSGCKQLGYPLVGVWLDVYLPVKFPPMTYFEDFVSRQECVVLGHVIPVYSPSNECKKLNKGVPPKESPLIMEFLRGGGVRGGGKFE